MFARFVPTGPRPKSGRPIWSITSDSADCYGVFNLTRLADVLKALSRALAEEGVRWYVFGAQAVVAYGRPRLTTDVDITVELSLDEAERFADRLRAHGFFPRESDGPNRIERTRVLLLVHESSGFPVDLVIAGPGLEMSFLEMAKPLDLSGVQVPVIDPADLITTKLLAGRPQDLEDVRGLLLERKVEVDLERTRDTLKMIEQALDRGDLLPELERLLEATKED
ncbi:MAG: nucleotidyltransferase [Acidobacteriota bacterium]